MTTPSRDGAAATLQQLSTDRAQLDATAPTPSWLLVALALLAGGWVVSPAVGSRTPGYLFALVGAVLAIDLARRTMGMQVKASGPRFWLVGFGWLAFTLLMYSVSLGLVSLELPLWVAVPAVVEMVVTYLLGRLVDRWAREGLRA